MERKLSLILTAPHLYLMPERQNVKARCDASAGFFSVDTSFTFRAGWMMGPRWRW